MGETVAAECEPGARSRSVEESVCGVRRGAAAAASVHAVLDGRTVAPIAAKGGREVDCVGLLSGGERGLEKCSRAWPSCADPGSGDGAADDSGGVFDDGRGGARIGASEWHSGGAICGAVGTSDCAARAV